MTQTHQPPPRGRGDANLTYLIGGLLVIIALTLGWLWMKERKLRVAYAQQVAELQQREETSLAALMQLMSSAAGSAQPLTPAELRPVRLSAQSLPALRVTPAAAQRMGVGPGQTVLVVRDASLPAGALQEVATAPATEPE
jgi:hypothetical protein